MCCCNFQNLSFFPMCCYNLQLHVYFFQLSFFLSNQNLSPLSLWHVVTFTHFFIFFTTFFIKKLFDQLLLQLPQSSPIAFLAFVRFNLLHIPCLWLHLNLSCLHTFSNNKVKVKLKTPPRTLYSKFHPTFYSSSLCVNKINNWLVKLVWKYL